VPVSHRDKLCPLDCSLSLSVSLSLSLLQTDRKRKCIQTNICSEDRNRCWNSAVRRTLALCRWTPWCEILWTLSHFDRVFCNTSLTAVKAENMYYVWELEAIGDPRPPPRAVLLPGENNGFNLIYNCYIRASVYIYLHVRASSLIWTCRRKPASSSDAWYTCAKTKFNVKWRFIAIQYHAFWGYWKADEGVLKMPLYSDPILTGGQLGPRASAQGNSCFMPPLPQLM